MVICQAPRYPLAANTEPDICLPDPKGRKTFSDEMLFGGVEAVQAEGGTIQMSLRWWDV